MSRRREVADLLRDIERAGGEVRTGRRCHWKVYIGGRFITTVSSSPSDVHAIKTARRQLRAAGLDV